MASAWGVGACAGDASIEDDEEVWLAANWWLENPTLPQEEVLAPLMRFMSVGIEGIRTDGSGPAAQA
jgi:hypothetical protein